MKVDYNSMQVICKVIHIINTCLNDIAVDKEDYKWQKPIKDPI